MPQGKLRKQLFVGGTAILVAALCGAWLVRRRADPSDRPLAASDTARLLEAAEALRTAIQTRSEQDAFRAAALQRASRYSRPGGDPGSCEAALVATSQAELEALVAITDREDPTSGWTSRRTQLLTGALGAVERLRADPRRAQGGGSEAIAANARRLVALPEPRFDFQLVLDEHLPPTVNGRDFTPGLMRGVLLAYDREAREVVCGARVAGANDAYALAKLVPRTGFAPDVPNDDGARAALADDLVSVTLRAAPGKLVKLVAKAD